MANKIKVLFWLRRTKTNKQGKPPILRLSYQRERVDKATGFYINPGLWNTIKQRAKGHKAPENDLNSWINTKIIDELKLRICKYYIQRQYVKKPLFIKKNISR